MALTGLKHETRRNGFKNKSAGPWGDGKPEAKDGVCPKCRTYDVELDANGFCRDECCRRQRLIEALESGEAMRTPTGVIVWTPGKVIRRKK